MRKVSVEKVRRRLEGLKAKKRGEVTLTFLLSSMNQQSLAFWILLG